ncbi:endophilin-A3 isoform X2 [Patella vulgata]|uniref:endophilin-A3 isoform X2 n=1 Tax=Patella vulgata TaxID=6465 RepID=UPI00217F4BCA|nr:endophilin-A3 isoform X2 [Patella vulgata]
MSLAGLKKQFNKANQYMSEKIGGAKGTELDEEFMEMERKIDVMGKLVEDLIIKTQEYLQPNPASRAKLSTMHTISKIRGQGKIAPYPQPEGILGEHMIKHGKDLGDESVFGSSLVECGETFKHLAEVKYSLEDTVKQNFLDPWVQLQSKEIKEVNHHRKKLSGRRLDYDCKRRKKEKGGNITEEDLYSAEEKFDESKSLAETAMNNLLDNEIEQIAQLQSFIEAQTDYHRQSMEALQSLCETLEEKRNEAANKPRIEHVPKRVASFRRSPSPSPLYETPHDNNFGGSGSYNFQSNVPPSYNQSVSNKQDASAEALYDFVPENEGELGFREGDMITLLSQVDENWFEGSLNGIVGYFPVNYVNVVVPLR